jgi:hypothetical protein
MSREFGLRWLYSEVLAQLIETAKLQEVEVPAYFAHARGTYGGRKVLLHTLRYHGQCLSQLTVSVMLDEPPADAAAADDPALPPGAVHSLTICGIPAPASRLPILALDLVATERGLPLVALDLAPTDPEYWDAHCRHIMSEVRAAAEPGVVHRKHPPFTEGAYSPLSLIAGARPDGAPHAIGAAAILLRGATLLYTPKNEERTLASEASAGRRNAWLRAQRNNGKEMSALGRMFGAEFATRYLEDFLFVLPL